MDRMPMVENGQTRGGHVAAQKKGTRLGPFRFGAGNEIRTRDPDLGKVVLYQLSYSRLTCCQLITSELVASPRGVEPLLPP